MIGKIMVDFFRKIRKIMTFRVMPLKSLFGRIVKLKRQKSMQAT